MASRSVQAAVGDGAQAGGCEQLRLELREGGRAGDRAEGLTAQSRPSPFNGPLSRPLSATFPAPWQRAGPAISPEAGMRRAGRGGGWGLPFSRPLATPADSIGI